MEKIIHHIRKQPEEIRRYILHILIIIAAIILLFIWIYSLGINLTDSNVQTKINNDLKTFSTLKDNMIGGYKSISN